MKTLGLSQIVKNEAHVIIRMLETIKDVVDHLTFVDTGSTDGTQDIIKKWANEHNIPCDIYDREFDNFENSRNYAMKMSKGKTDYCFWLDADEQLVIDHKLFDKNKLDKDLYMFTTHIDQMKYTRNECWNNKKDFKWYGPVHEFIVPKDENLKLTSGLMSGIDVIVKMDGGSWKEDVSSKYRTHATMLENYIDYKDRDPRWVFYTAQSYHDSANIKGNDPENHERLRRALKYYQERVNISGGYHEERFYAQYRIGTIFMKLNRPWEDTLTQLLKAYSMDMRRAEPFKIIIEYYQQIGEWSMAYLYAKFAYDTYHKVNLYPARVLFVDNTLYSWKFAELYANSCYYIGKKSDAKNIHQILVDITKKTPDLFNVNDIDRINKNSQFFLK